MNSASLCVVAAILAVPEPGWRAALAALLYSNGNVAEAEEQWEQACARSVGCGRYKDLDYVRRIRRWPPKMVDKLDAFLKIK